MTRSMTGFAHKTVLIQLDSASKSSLTLALKSLNSRFLDVNCKLLYPLGNWETDFVKLFKDTLYRGSITFSIQVSNPAIFKGTIEPSLDTIGGYLKALDRIQSKFSLEGTLSIADILQLPNIFIAPEQELDEQAKKLIFDATKEVIQELIKHQTNEGTELAHDLEQRMAIITQEIDAIEKTFELHMIAQKQKVQEAVAQVGLDENKYADLHKNALYATLDKIDIHEEIVRFKNHVKTISSTLQSSAIEKGKRLDFIMQELGREINTITAKASDSTISAHAINVKVELEKAREQAQNIV